MPRAAALLAVTALHGAVLAALWTGQPAAAPAAPREVSVRLLPAQVPVAAPPLRMASPRLHLPSPPLVPPPAFTVQAEALVPEAAAPPLLLAAAAPPAPAPRVEPAPLPTLQTARRAACASAPHPPALRDRGIEGVVRLRVWVDELGRAGQVLLAASSGWRLFDDAAMAQARRCPFHPAQRGSEPVGSWVEFPVRFALESSSNG
ncbi:energy transducer TonB [Pelomonas aquatica]|nr:energy transducer TonB [Pelomonas aquatica]